MRVKDSAKEIAILKTALNMIEAEGLAGLKMSDLAKRAGVATGTLYIYYPSKDAIVQSLYSFVFGQLSLDVLREIQPAVGLKEQLRLISFNYLNKFITYPEHRIFIEQYLRSPYAQEEHKNLFSIQQYIEPVINLFASGIKEGIFKPMDPMLFVTLCRGALDNYGWCLISKEVSEIEMESFDGVFEVIWDGISKR